MTLRDLVTHRSGLCDRLLGLDEVPWNERNKSKLEKAKQAAVQGKRILYLNESLTKAF
ncbi:hypothetical protein [Moorena producens]|uniref:hypothetical protein n=1 Tax=Moorena producens TaxID=1155739 RepID=UPI001930EE89|nr:hypothetical protein [Moorena producens]